MFVAKFLSREKFHTVINKLSFIFNKIKKKKNKRQLSALWLSLIIIELFCPILCDEDSSAVAIGQTTAKEINRVQFVDEASTSFKAQTAFAASDRSAQEQQKQICHDECLCHVTAVTEIPFSIRKPSLPQSDRIISRFKEPVLSSLPPPDTPPNIS